MDKFVIIAFERLLKLPDIFQMHALDKQFGTITSQLSWLIPRGARVHIFNSNALNVLILSNQMGEILTELKNCPQYMNLGIRHLIMIEVIV